MMASHGSSRQSEGADPFAAARERMVARQIAGRGVKDPRVLDAMRRVPRQLFADPVDAAEAHEDYPLPIGESQTISQPYIVAFMIEALGLPDGGRVLEIGTGLGYQAAVMAEAGFEVFTIEILPDLAERAAAILSEAGYGRVHTRVGDGSEGWPEEAPFDGIIVAAAPARLPRALIDQLGPEGSLVIPLGDEEQILWRYRRTPSGFQGEELFAVRFVPLK
ncbi:MAG: protein-L-isoaspartate(D-aspartate) O-methyltransferase [Opitutaceae bacterium]